MDQTQGPMRMTFDSDESKTPSGTGDPGSQLLAGILGAMVGWKGVQVYSADGKFLRLEGLEHLLSKMRAAPGGAQLVGMMKQLLKPLLRDALTRHWGKLLPAEPVGPGDSWRRTVDFDKVPMFGKIDFEFTCWLTDVADGPDGKVAVLVCDGRARIRNRDVDMSGMGLPMAPKTTVDDMTMLIRQTVKFPIAVGLATEVTGDLDVDASMTMKIVGQTASTKLQQATKFTYTLTPRK
ncbi:MAG: hypothetical protein FJ291_23300 [Planctomycetes bacterium]|nr:hypothetical protein [Planctomycetota bacterium]